tara:strand:+ start:3506 stop:3715 length:210 start_codon:yes stop_codon:yes gene_type:complete
MIKMIQQLKQFNKWLEGLQADLIDQKKNIKKAKEEMKEEEEEVELTCCGDEVVGWVEDYRICPTCKEHI